VVAGVWVRTQSSKKVIAGLHVAEKVRGLPSPIIRNLFHRCHKIARYLPRKTCEKSSPRFGGRWSIPGGRSRGTAGGRGAYGRKMLRLARREKLMLSERRKNKIRFPERKRKGPLGERSCCSPRGEKVRSPVRENEFGFLCSPRL